MLNHKDHYNQCCHALMRCWSDARTNDMDLLCCSIEAAACALLAWARYIKALRERKERWPEIGTGPGPRKQQAK